MSIFKHGMILISASFLVMLLSAPMCNPCTDTDGDGICDEDDICPNNPDNTDTDGDGVCDPDDPCPNDVNDDSDEDGVCDSDDPCPTDPDDLCLITCPTGSYLSSSGVYTLSTSSGNITGTAFFSASPCTYGVTGTSEGEDGAVTILATETDDPNNACCASFEIHGTASSDCSSISGSFTNSCGSSGGITLNREGSKIRFLFGPAPETAIVR